MKKRLVYLLLVVLCASFVFAQSTVKFPHAACSADGFLNLSLMHEGMPLHIDEMAIVATDHLNKTFSVPGTWYFGFVKTDYIFPHEGNDLSQGTFISDNADFTAKGEYIISLMYLKNKGDLKLEKHSFAFSCAGKSCVKHDDCAADEGCYDRCVKISCPENMRAVDHVCPKEKIIVKEVEKQEPIIEKPTLLPTIVAASSEEAVKPSLFNRFIDWGKEFFKEFIV